MNRFGYATIAGLSLAALGLSASAETATVRPTDPIYACSEKADDAERLACFDAAVAALKSAEISGTVRTIDVAAMEKIERESFGFSLPSLSDVFRRSDRDGKGKPSTEDQIQEVTYVIKSVSVNSVTRKATIKLENGQIWEQIDTEELSRSKVRKAKEARIKRASLGSFLMTIDGGSGIRVRRVN